MLNNKNYLGVNGTPSLSRWLSVLQNQRQARYIHKIRVHPREILK